MLRNRVVLREAILAVAAAILGLASAIALLPAWVRPARAGQLPGFMTSVGLDSGASYHFYLTVVAFTLVAPLIARPLIARLANAQMWAFVTATIALSFSLWIAIAQENVWWTAIPPLVIAIIATALRNTRQHFHRRDAILLPAFLSVFMAVTDIATSASFGQRVIVSAALVLIVRLALRRGGSPFLATPIALFLQSHYNGYHERHNGWLPLALILITPFLLRPIRNTRRLRIAIAVVIYPLTILFYASATSTLAAEGMPRGDLFEDSHNLTVASELLRGEKAYRDIIPSHGLIQDGFLDYLILRSGKQTAGRVLETHGVIGSFVSVALYALATCASGSPDAGLFAVFLGLGIASSGGAVRATPAFFALAALVCGVRRRNTRSFAVAGALFVLAGFTSLDFAGYTAIAIIVAILRMPSRRAAAIATTIGVACAGAVALIGLTIAGITTAFIRTTFLDIARWGPVYALAPWSAPEILRQHRYPPELLLGFLDRSSIAPLFWACCILGVAAVLWRRRQRSPFAPWHDALFVLAIWVIAAGTSYAERQHFYVMLIATPIIVTVIRLVNARVAAPIVVAMLIVAQPTNYVTGVDILRHTHGPLSADVTQIPELPRARGALYRNGDAAIIRSAQKYVATLQPGETFFDFTNRGALYFLFDRDCPIRQVEVAFYERPEQQREVIERINTNHAIRAALIPRDGDLGTMVDEVPNQTRAPLVWQYLQQHFRPEYAEGDVIFWKRID